MGSFLSRKSRISAWLAGIVARASTTSSAAPTRTKSFCMSTIKSAGWRTRSCGSIMGTSLERRNRVALRSDPSLERLPDALRGRRHLDLVGAAARAGVGERIGDRVHRRRCRADGAELADALDPERVGQAGNRGVEAGAEVRQPLGPRHRIVHEAAGDELAAAVVIDDPLPKRLADALDRAAVDLAADDGRAHHPADVVDRSVGDDLHVAAAVSYTHLTLPTSDLV